MSEKKNTVVRYLHRKKRSERRAPLPYISVSFLPISAETSSDVPFKQWTLLTATSNVFERAPRRAAVCGNVPLESVRELDGSTLARELSTKCVAGATL